MNRVMLSSLALVLFLTTLAAAEDPCQTCGTEPRFPAEAAFLEAHGYPANDFTVLMSWSELCRNGSGKYVTGYHMMAASGGESFDLYSDGADVLLTDAQVAVLGVPKKNWALPPIERSSEIPVAVGKALPLPPTPVGPARSLPPSAGVVAPEPDVARALQEDEERALTAGKGAQRIGLNVALERAITAQGSTVSDGTWREVPGGGWLWSVALFSPGALAMRVHFSQIALPPGGQVVVYNYNDTQEAYGPYSSPAPGRRDLWSATSFSDGVVVECVVPTSGDRSAVQLTIDRVTHNYVPMGEVGWAKAAGACNLDVTCFAGWITASTAVGGIGSVGSNGALWCTGSLLADSDPATTIPYFLTANHCVGAADAAASVEVYWLYQTATCLGAPPNPATVPRTSGGATLLATTPANTGTDFCLLRLNNPAASGVAYAGWLSTPNALGTSTVCIHHPSGDYKRISFGTITDVPETWRNDRPADRYYQSSWIAGVTEGGSSGSPLFNGSSQQVIGQLWGGPSSCAPESTDLDYYGRFDVSFPLMESYLDSTEPGPPNDDFSNRMGIFGMHAQVIQSNIGATPESGEPSYVNRGRSVWWCWTAPETAIVTIDTIGSTFDTVLGIYTGSLLGGLTAVREDDNSGGGGNTSKAVFDGVGGTTYIIAVDGYLGASGAITLNLYSGPGPFTISLSASPPAGGYVTGEGTYPAGDSITVHATAMGDYSFANWTEGGTPVSTSADYEFIVNVDRTLVANFAGPPPSNDNYLNAPGVFIAPTQVTGTNVDATPEADEPSFVHRGRSVWWYWMAPQSGLVTIDTIGSDFDTVLGIYTGFPLSGLVPLREDDNGGGGDNTSKVVFDAVAGTPYIVAVDGYNGASGSITLNIGEVLPLSGALGNTTVFGLSVKNANRPAMPFTMTENGTLESVSMYHASGTGNMILGVYGTGANGLPGPRLGTTASTPVNGAAGWQTIPLTSPVPVSAGTTIWLAWVYQNPVSVYYQAGTPGRALAPIAWAGGMPNPFGTSTQANNVYSIYATYTRNVPVPPTTIGNTTVFGLSVKNANRPAMPFTMTEDGTLESVSMYHASGTGNMILGVYDTGANGLPGPRLGTTASTAVSGVAGWQTIPLTSPVSVSAGTTIWLAWVYQNPVSVYYQAGTPGRALAPIGWPGGMPNPFGTSTQANNVYSIYATYTSNPPVPPKTIGNTTVFGLSVQNAKRPAMPFSVTEDGTLESVSMYHASGTGNMILGVYGTGANGLPGPRLGVTASTPVSGVAGWQTIPLTSPAFVYAGETIWLAWVYQNPVSVYYQAGTPGRALAPVGWTGGMPNPFGTSTQANNVYSIYATYSANTIMLPGNVPLEMEWCPPGTFMMGRYPGEQGSFSDEDPQHAVTVQGFWMGKYELTKAQWTAVMGTTPWSWEDYVLSDPDSPAVYVSWNDARSFITALNAHITNTGQGSATMRLPSEAEWEYAARADTITRFYWGDDPSETLINDYAWWSGNASDVGENYAHVVGLAQPNAWGLYDMSGNVWEWCEDDWHGSYTDAPSDGSAWVNSPRGLDRVFRGGSWYDLGWWCRSAVRYNNDPSYAYASIGFRLCR